MGKFIAHRPSAVNPEKETWKADGFINVYMSTRSGGRKKIGAIPLRKSRLIEAQLLEFLSSNEENVEIFRQKIEIEFNTTEVSEEHMLDL